MDSYHYSISKSFSEVAIRIVWYVTNLFEVLLLFRFFLKLLGANFYAPFTSFIYAITYSFASPFFNVFQATPIQGGGVFEWSSLLAMLVFYLIAVAVVRLFLEGKRVSTTTTETTIVR